MIKSKTEFFILILTAIVSTFEVKLISYKKSNWLKFCLKFTVRYWYLEDGQLFLSRNHLFIIFIIFLEKTIFLEFIIEKLNKTEVFIFFAVTGRLLTNKLSTMVCLFVETMTEIGSNIYIIFMSQKFLLKILQQINLHILVHDTWTIGMKISTDQDEQFLLCYSSLSSLLTKHSSFKLLLVALLLYKCKR